MRLPIHDPIARAVRRPARAMLRTPLHAMKLLVASMAALSALASAGTVSYTYDALGRIASVVYSNGTSTTTVSYAYDAAGNRTSVTTSGP